MKNVLRFVMLTSMMSMIFLHAEYAHAQAPTVTHSGSASSANLSSGNGIKISWSDNAVWGSFSGSATAKTDATVYVNVYKSGYSVTFPMTTTPSATSPTYAMYPGYSIYLPGSFTISNVGNAVYNAAVANGYTLPAGSLQARFEVHPRDYTYSSNTYINNAFPYYDSKIYPFVNLH